MALVSTQLTDSLFQSIPPTLRKELFETYDEITRNYIERRWEPSELNGGKFSEVVYTILKGYCESSYNPVGLKPSNMVDACRALENSCPTSSPRSIRIQIPRMLIALYEIRNNRGVGHIGGDVDPNPMDSSCVLHIAQWVLAELIRIFHSIEIEEATSLVDALTERIVPLVWEIGAKKRVLSPKLSMKSKSLLLLYSSRNPISDSTLFDWIEHSNISVYRRDVLRPLHREKLIEFDEDNHLVVISPIGIVEVEQNILST